MNLNTHVRELVTEGKLDELDILLPLEPRAIRHLVSLTFQPDDELRANACRGVAMAARYHPELVEQVVRRLIWAMNDESGTNALTAPDVIMAVADERSEILLPMVSDLTRLAKDEGLRDRLTAALRTVAENHPGAVGQGIQDTLNKRFQSKDKKKGRGYGGCGCGKK